MNAAPDRSLTPYVPFHLVSFARLLHRAQVAGIRAAQYGFWASHVEAVMPDGSLLGAHFDGGVLARAPGYDQRNLVREMFVDVPASIEMTDAFHTFLRSQLGKP